MLAKILILWFALSSLGFGASTKFVIVNGSKEFSFTKKELLNRKDLVSLSIPLLNYPGKKLKVDAVPIKALLDETQLGKDQIVMFNCLDGFAGPLEKSLLVADEPGQSKAYLAIEPDSKWPPLPKNADQTAGPFYLVWANPEFSEIPPEHWPYQLIGFRFEHDLKSVFPKIVPESGGKLVDSGFLVYKRRCMSCHTINHQGTSQMGPDLNQPMNPVDYFKEDALRKFLRKPSSVRAWKGMKMRWVGDNTLSDAEVNSILAYLKFMNKKR